LALASSASGFVYLALLGSHLAGREGARRRGLLLAAGGLAAGAVAFMDARLISGIEYIIAQSGLEQAAANADWVITGEGRFDRQSLHGKVISGISAIAARTNAKVCVLAGQVALEPPDFQKHGINCAMACMSEGMKLQHALKHADKLLAKTAAEFAARYL
ncbi:hypothetical protein LCGC14_2550480, partial [marine sediment metagenome]